MECIFHEHVVTLCFVLILHLLIVCGSAFSTNGFQDAHPSVVIPKLKCIGGSANCSKFLPQKVLLEYELEMKPKGYNKNRVKRFIDGDVITQEASQNYENPRKETSDKSGETSTVEKISSETFLFIILILVATVVVTGMLILIWRKCIRPQFRKPVWCSIKNSQHDPAVTRLNEIERNTNFSFVVTEPLVKQTSRIITEVNNIS